jgi:Zn-dependent peptidase ImmA (M78 family)/transcriptional regulator with XRE-family HTH domain
LFDRATLSANLLRIRLDRGETQAQVAEAAGMSRVGYRNVESGDAMPRTESLLKIAEALGVGIETLFRPAETLRAVRFRAQKKMTAREQLLLEVGRWIHGYAELEDLVGEKRERSLPRLISALSKRTPGAARAIDAAGEARKVLNLGPKDAIRDICGLLEDNGIKVYTPVLASEGFFGLSVGEQDGGPAVVVNTWDRISVERWIFTAAHEFAHVLLHLASFDVDESHEVEGEEAEADVFASYFLMPEALFTKEWSEAAGLGFMEAVFKVKRIFRVSWKTVVYRLASRPGAPKDLWGRFFGEYKRRTGRSLRATEEPGGLRPDEFTAGPAPRGLEPEQLSPSDFVEDRLARLVRRALKEKKITYSRAAEVLRVDETTMRARAKSWLT